MSKQLTIPEYIDQAKPNEKWDITNKWNVGDRYIYINRIWECVDNTPNNAIWADVGKIANKIDIGLPNISGIKYIINSDETLVIEQDYEYNVTQLYVDGVIECNGVINLIS